MRADDGQCVSIGSEPHYEEYSMQQNANDNATAPLGLTESQWEAICALRPADEAISPTAEGQRPASIYFSEERYQAEIEQLFKKVPLVAAPSCYLKPGESLAQDGYGIPMLLTRDKNGVVRAFVNACRHRGSKIVEGNEPVASARLSCPYHAWTYATDGRLIGIPRPETFPSAKKCELGLVTLECYEAGGMIWVGMDPKEKPGLLEGSDQLHADLEAFGLHTMHMYGRRTYDLKANWKFVMEPFLEAYHIQRLHADSIADMFLDVPSVYGFLGHHQRQTSGKANFSPDLLKGNIDNLHKYITHAYLCFPNTVVITSPYYMSIMILMPRGANRTVVDYFMLTKSEPDSDKAKELFARSFELIHEVFGGEDFRAAELQTAALGNGNSGVETLYFGGLEEMITPFHESIESFLDKPES
ncbi:MAG: SRPBCC family protein [Spongiibacter sp.]|nr:SRPBCC family protein [Spongiibacter sp.]